MTHHTNKDKPMFGSGSIIFLLLLALAVFGALGSGGCASVGGAGTETPTLSCAELAGVNSHERVVPVWILNPRSGVKSPAYVLGGVRIVSTNEVVRTPPYQRCGRGGVPHEGGLRLF